MAAHRTSLTAGTAVRIGTALAASLMLTGCGSFGGAASNPQAAQPDPTTGPAGPVTAAPVIDPVTGEAKRPIVIDFDPQTECPQVQVITGTSSYATYDGPPSPASVRYQLSIDNVARECVLLPGNRVQIKIGVEGQALLGEKGLPGTVSAPIRFVVRDRDNTVLSSTLLTATATIPPGAAQAGYRLVSADATVPIDLAKPLRSYDLLVGFDAKGTAGRVGAKATVKAKRPRRPAAE